MLDRLYEGLGGTETTEPDTIAELLHLVEYGNDAANAELLARRAGGQIVYNATAKAWLVFDGRRWVKDASGGVMRLAKATADDLLRRAVNVPADDLRGKAVKYAVALSGLRKLEAMVKLAESEMPAVSDEFDCDAFTLNVANGTLDLRSGVLRPHDPADRLTKLVPVLYNPGAVASRWERFLDEIFLGRSDLIEYVQRLVGYMLTGDVSEHVLPIAYGLGANGKSVLVRVLQAMLGDYAQHADVSLFLARRDHGASPDLARLKGVRLVAASEMPEGGRLSENLIKSLTGGDKVAARHLYGEFFEFSPTAKFLIATNYKPTVRGDDEGIWRRLKLLPFNASFRGDDRDPHLAETLELELPGILRWAVDGCRRWQAEGLADPRPVVTAMADYRSESDAIGAFLADRCVARDDCEVRSDHLAAEYRRWCEAGGEKMASSRTLMKKLRERGFDSRESNGRTLVIGLGLRDDRETEQ